MPAAPVSAGNRRRLNATCEVLRRGGFAIDLAYLQHEDQIYRRFGHHPPTDADAMVNAFDRVFHIPAATLIPLKTWTGGFTIDAWCPPELDEFVAWYFDKNPDTCAIVVNYVFLSRCLNAVPVGVTRVIDTHDRFADRHLQYRPFRAEPNFFYTDRTSEAVGLSRADMILAIQSVEADYFRRLVGRDVYLLPPTFPERADFRTPGRLCRLGFIGHGNDANLFSISKFAHGWAASWSPDLPVVIIAGEICESLDGLKLPGVELAGYVDSVETFYAGVDAVIAPMLMGSGLKMKVAEALSLGRPVIGTRVAFEGFDAKHPVHRLEGVADTIMAIIRLHNDSEALAALTTACAELLARYNARAATCETAWLNALPHRSARCLAPPTAVAPDVSTTVGAGVSVRVEHSLRSLPVADADGGILVATENPSPADARAAGYPSERRRWFVRQEPDGSRSSAGLPAALLGGRVSLSPEWIHRRSLPQPVREAIAGSFGDAQADWKAGGLLIGYETDGLTVVTCVPSFLVARPRATATFLLGEGATVREVRLTGATALARSPRLAFTTARGELTPVPASLTFEPLKIDGAASPILATCMEPSRLKDILFLSDDLVGFIRLAPKRHKWFKVQR